jgi:hypothetical protein
MGSISRYVPSMSSRLALVQAVLMSAILASGCVPFPHTVDVTPRIEGILSAGDGPLSGAEVRLTQILSDVVCSKAEQITYTDEAGKFQFQPISVFRFGFPLYGDPLYRWNVCVLAKGLTYAGTVDGTIGVLPPASVKLDCFINEGTIAVTPETTGREIDSLQICKSSHRHITMRSSGRAEARR